jgi:hypothetical protein
MPRLDDNLNAGCQKINQNRVTAGFWGGLEVETERPCQETYTPPQAQITQYPKI